jgi:hypothetical protein
MTYCEGYKSRLTYANIDLASNYGNVTDVCGTAAKPTGSSLQKYP